MGVDVNHRIKRTGGHDQHRKRATGPGEFPILRDHACRSRDGRRASSGVQHDVGEPPMAIRHQGAFAKRRRRSDDVTGRMPLSDARAARPSSWAGTSLTRRPSSDGRAHHVQRAPCRSRAMNDAWCVGEHPPEKDAERVTLQRPPKSGAAKAGDSPPREAGHYVDRLPGQGVGRRDGRPSDMITAGTLCSRIAASVTNGACSRRPRRFTRGRRCLQVQADSVLVVSGRS